MSVDRLRELKRQADAARANDDRAWDDYRAHISGPTLREAMNARDRRRRARLIYDQAMRDFIEGVMQ